MNDSNHIRSIARVLYTQNPFYLISCGFMIYGLRIATLSIGDMFSRGAVLSAALAAYSLLMAITVVAVVRCGKVWDDARSIFLVVLISFVSLSVGLDELCVSNWRAAVGLLTVAALFCLVTTELVIRGCRIRFRLGYRLPLYAMLGVFFATPVIAGYAMNENWMGDRNWSAMLFSCAIATSMLLWIPSVRYGRAWTRGNGTPWSWPCYPLSVFVILVILAALRSHAIWMSFSADYLTVSFEPFLWLPIATALLVLMVESDRRKVVQRRSFAAICLAPALLLLSVSNGGQTHLPTRIGLQHAFGSATTLCLIILVSFYGYAVMRRVRGSVDAVIVTLFALGAGGFPLGMTSEFGIHHWMICGAATFFSLIHCFARPSNDLRWLRFVIFASATIVIAGLSFADTTTFLGAAVISMVLGSMAIGACFDTVLARGLRVGAATLSVCLSAAAAALSLDGSSAIPFPLIGVLAGTIGMVYGWIVHRTGWLYVAAIHFSTSLATFIAAGHGDANWANFVENYWPIQVGMGSFLAGISITSVKTGVCRKVRHQIRRRKRRSKFRKGF